MTLSLVIWNLTSHSARAE